MSKVRLLNRFIDAFRLVDDEPQGTDKVLHAGGHEPAGLRVDFLCLHELGEVLNRDLTALISCRNRFR